MVSGCEVARRSWLGFGASFLLIGSFTQYCVGEFFAEEVTLSPRKSLPTHIADDGLAQEGVEEDSSDEDSSDEDDELLAEASLDLEEQVIQDEHLALELLLDANPCEETDAVTQRYLKRAIHMLDVYFNMIQVSTRVKTTGPERPTQTQQVDSDQIWLTDFMDFIRRSLEVDANTYEDSTCFLSHQPPGCRKFHMKAKAVESLYGFARERHQIEEHVLTKRIFMEMAFYPYDPDEGARGRLTQRFREMLFLLVYPSVTFELDDVDTWANITESKWKAFLDVHGIPNEQANEFAKWFRNETSDSQGEMSPRLWEQAVEEAQGFSAEALEGMGADIFGHRTVIGELEENLHEEMDGSAEDDHLLSVLAFNVAVLDDDTRAQLKDDLHILEIYFHMIDLKDPNNLGFITKENFDDFVNTSFKVDANTYPANLCKRTEPCRKFFLKASVSGTMFKREMEKHWGKGNDLDVATFKMSKLQFLEMALPVSCKRTKLNTSFRRLLFLMLNPFIEYSLRDYTKWAPINHSAFDAFVSLHQIAGKEKELYVKYFDAMTSDTEGLLDLGGMELAVGKARKGAGCDDTK